MDLYAELRWQASRAIGITRRAIENAGLERRAQDDIQIFVNALEEHSTDSTVLMGPINTAGAAHEWMQTVDRLAGMRGRSVRAEALGPNKFKYRADYTIPRSADLGDFGGWRDFVLSTIDHVIFESCLPILGDFTSGSFLNDVPALEDTGVRTAVLMHGSDVRDSELHQRQISHSLFAGTSGPYWRSVAKRAGANRELLGSYSGIKLVSTPGLVSHVPGSTWLPLVVDIPRFVTESPVLRRPVPVIAHAPSNPLFKGTAFIEPVLRRLEAEGLIEYRQISGVPHAEMPGFLADADVIVDQLTLGDMGVQVAESLAAQRLVVANVAQPAREVIGRDLPVVQADPSDFERVMRTIVTNRDDFRKVAEMGPDYVRSVHSGRRAQEVLAGVFGWGV